MWSIAAFLSLIGLKIVIGPTSFASDGSYLTLRRRALSTLLVYPNVKVPSGNPVASLRELLHVTLLQRVISLLDGKLPLATVAEKHLTVLLSAEVAIASHLIILNFRLPSYLNRWVSEPRKLILLVSISANVQKCIPSWVATLPPNRWIELSYKPSGPPHPVLMLLTDLPTCLKLEQATTVLLCNISSFRHGTPRGMPPNISVPPAIILFAILPLCAIVPVSFLPLQARMTASLLSPYDRSAPRLLTNLSRILSLPAPLRDSTGDLRLLPGSRLIVLHFMSMAGSPVRIAFALPLRVRSLLHTRLHLSPSTTLALRRQHVPVVSLSPRISLPTCTTVVALTSPLRLDYRPIRGRP